MRRDFLLLAALFALAAGFVVPHKPAHALPPAVSQPATANPLFLKAKAQRCIRLGRLAGRDVLVNLCGSCQIVKVHRRRPGGSMPSSRDLPIPAGAQVPLSFRGPGQTRVISNAPCRPPATSPSEKKDASPESRQCVRFHRTKNGQSVLVNNCETCRIVTLQQQNQQGSGASRTYTIAAKKYMPYDIKEYGPSKIIRDKLCR